jgi:8-amino-7-oxononanoate synthase
MSTSPVLNRIRSELDGRRAAGLFRTIAPCYDGSGRLDFSTNSYLGLHMNREIADNSVQLAASRNSGADRTGGNLASRLVAETSPLYRDLENEIAAWEGAETALVFTSGYAANLGIISALCTRSTEVFSDRLNHASIYDGIRLSGCRLSRYRHCDMTDLQHRLAASRAAEKVIITDTIFSMDGDQAPLADIAQLSKEHHALVMVDEAHAGGLFGEHGSGCVEATGTAAAIDLRMGTLSKALAGLGGYVAAPAVLKDYFVNFSRSLVYSTGLPHSVLAHNLAAVRHVRQHPEYGKRLQTAAETFRRKLGESGFSTAPSSTQIIPCYTRDEHEALALSAYLREHDIIVPAIRPPTVPVGTARLRFSWSLLFNEADGDTVIRHLQKWKQKHV